MLKYILPYYFIFSFCWLSAQEDKSACLNEILALEDSVFSDRKTLTNKVAFIHYKVKSEDWEHAVVQSEVKMYQNDKSMAFYSNQVDIFSDEDEMFLILKAQKIVLADISQKKLNVKTSEDDFAKFRKSFLQNCEVQVCYFTDSINGIKLIKLNVKEEVNEYIAIKTMTYKIDTKKQRLISNTVTYTKDYKLKKMEMDYVDYKFLSNYKFSKPRKLVLNQKGKLLDKYKGYEFIDERN